MTSGRDFELRIPEILRGYFHEISLAASRDASALER
jgi:hypothetical protein